MVDKGRKNLGNNNKINAKKQSHVSKKQNDDDEATIPSDDDEEINEDAIDNQYCDEGQYIDLPWLASGDFMWYSLTENYNRHRGENKIRVSSDYIPLQKTLRRPMKYEDVNF